MKKVYLDDARPAPDDSWIVVRNLEDAKAQLLSGNVEHMSLDHDLGDAPCDVCEGECDRPCPHGCHNAYGTGTDMVHWMMETGHWPANRPTVHSSNPAGAARMKGLIESYGPYTDEGKRI